jgi:hypothetical protein
VLIDGKPVTVKVAQVRLCHSRMLYVRAYLRESQEMVFDVPRPSDEIAVDLVDIVALGDGFPARMADQLHGKILSLQCGASVLTGWATHFRPPRW